MNSSNIADTIKTSLCCLVHSAGSTIYLARRPTSGYIVLLLLLARLHLHCVKVQIYPFSTAGIAKFLFRDTNFLFELVVSISGQAKLELVFSFEFSVTLCCVSFSIYR